MRVVNLQKLAELQRNPKNIRNLCIMAHVDHGKTTLADSLVASNGIISKRMVGKLRYMDSRKDEQERGITMKSSSISLYCIHKDEDFLVNLIDSPGHVDFSSEVSTAVRLCDGAIIVVDAVEGVCAQTKVVLRQAWFESIRPVLVLNKIDRLIVEMKFQPLDAYIHISQVLEQVNAYVGELFAAEVLSKASMKAEWHIDEEDDSHIYFSPAQGNVVFASAVDGWGFTIQHFAKMFATKLGVSETDLNNSLWGDFYYSPKTKSILEGAQMKAKKPLFVQIVLENLWSIYDSVVIRKDKLMVEKIVKSLNLQIPPRELAHTDVKIQLQAVMGQWLPLSNSILGMVCEKLPSPLEVSESRAESLVTSQSGRFTDLPETTKYLKKSFMTCSSSEDEPVVAFISKMVPVERRSLPQNKARPLSAEDIARRREMIRKKLAEQQLSDKPAEPREEVKAEQNEDAKSEDKKEDESEEVFIAFARVFSGTLRKGQQLYVLGPKYDPNTMADVSVDPEATLKDLKPGQHVTRGTIGDLYLLMGREMEQLEEAPAGNVIGIGGLDEHVLKSATLSSTLHCPAFSEITQMAVPIVRVAVEPSRPADMPALVRGLKLLNQADPCVQVLLQETGEHVIVTAGEVHLQRCLQDLRERYAKVEISASQPIVPFRETVVPRSSGTEAEPSAKKTEDEGLIDIQTPNKRCAMKIRAVPLPAEVIEFLERNSVSIKALTREETSETVTIDVSTPLAKKASNVGASELKAELENVLDKCGSPWKGIVDSIWSFGPRRCGPNLLINRSAVKLPNVWQSRADCDSTMLDIHNSFVNGFQLATLSGPLCEEPLMGVAFFVEDWNIVTGDSETNANQPYGPFSGQIMSSVKEGCRRAFQAQPQRLMAAMYTCTIQVSAEVLGKMYGVISRRHGRVLAGDLDEGTATFSVTAVLPVVESFDLANEIRKQTSGQASPQLVFSHWEVIDTDPFWTPSTEEELELYGDKGDSINRAQVYMNSVRRRKGLSVLEKVVEFAEKQRTLSRKV